MGETPGSPTVSMKLQRIAGPGSAQLCAKRGVACLVRHWRKLVVTEEPDALITLVRVCGEGAGEPVPLPGSRRLPASARTSLRLPGAAEAWRSGSSRQGCASYEVKVLCRQLPDSDGKHIRGVGR